MRRHTMCAWALALALLLPASAAAQERKGGEGKGAEGAEAAEKSPYKKFSELAKGAVHRPGFFDTYEKGDHLYLAVPKDRLGRDFLMAFQIAQGIGARGLFGGTMLNIFEGNVVALERYGDRVFLVKRPHRFTAPEGTPAARAVDLSFGSSVLESAKIESIRDDSALVIDVARRPLHPCLHPHHVGGAAGGADDPAGRG